ncbi:hypothetical protein HDU91_000255 [Kappamyces sp. JEL0680]|nr:hypothetical protein HDU91_000255 [Kappamyces sp. JEL0680]
MVEKGHEIPDALLDRQVILETDIYLRYLYSGHGHVNSIQMNRIRPCTPIHIKKYTAGIHKRVLETPALYHRFVVPYMESLPASRTAWIQKVLNKESETETALYHDTDPTTGFFLGPDSKWDGKQTSQLYLLAIAQSPAIRSLRDLRGSHLGFLKHMRSQTLAVLEAKYNLSWRDVRMLIHYQPSYYHFHVHVIHVAIHGLEGTVCHLLEDVIESLEMDPDFYTKKSLCYTLSSFHPLFPALSAVE